MATRRSLHCLDLIKFGYFARVLRVSIAMSSSSSEMTVWRLLGSSVAELSSLLSGGVIDVLIVFRGSCSACAVCLR
ncbi:hypothetical protein CH063_06036, partial [Colletotrichum higginsianum]